MRRNGLLECDCGAAVIKTTDRGFVCVSCGQAGERTGALEPNPNRNTPRETRVESETEVEPETEFESETNWIPGPSF